MKYQLSYLSKMETECVHLHARNDNRRPKSVPTRSPFQDDVADLELLVWLFRENTDLLMGFVLTSKLMVVCISASRTPCSWSRGRRLTRIELRERPDRTWPVHFSSSLSSFDLHTHCFASSSHPHVIIQCPLEILRSKINVLYYLPRDCVLPVAWLEIPCPRHHDNSRLAENLHDSHLFRKDTPCRMCTP